MDRKAKGKFLKSKRLPRLPSADKISIDAILDGTTGESAVQPSTNTELIDGQLVVNGDIQPANSEEELRQNLKEIDDAVTEVAKVPKSHSRHTSVDNSDGSAHSARRIVFVPKQNSRDSAATSPSSHPTPPSSEVNNSSPTAKKLVDVDSPQHQSPVATQPNSPLTAKPLRKDDIGQRILALCQKKEWLMVENLIRSNKVKPANLSARDELGLTPLMYVVREGIFQLADKMLELGADLNVVTYEGHNLTHLAAKYGNVDTFRYLSTKNMDLTSFGGPNKQLPLHIACGRSSQLSLPLIQYLIKNTRTADNDCRLIADKNSCIPLLLACECGNLLAINELLSIRGEEQASWRRTDTGETALHLACKRKDPEMIRVILEYKADVNRQNNAGQTPLHIIAENGDDSFLRMFYAAKANANIADKKDQTPLHIATLKGNAKMVEILIDKFGALISARTKDGSSLIHLAAQHGYPEIAQILLKRGVPLMMPNKAGALGIHCAAAAGHLQSVKALLQKGSHVDAKTKDGHTALHIAVAAGKPDVVECLLGSGANVHIKGGKNGETPLHIAAGLEGPAGQTCAQFLIKSGSEINDKLEDGETPLHIAARKGLPRMTRLLLDEGADPSVISKVNETAVHLASKYCHFEALKMILSHVENTDGRNGVSHLINLVNLDGETAVHHAGSLPTSASHYQNEDVDIIRILLEYGGDIGQLTTATQQSVLHYCARTGNEAILSEIVTKIGPGAVQIALNKQAKNGWSPLLEASDKGHLGVVKLLLHHHARVDVFDEYGKTALHLAAENDHTEVCDALVSHKAFVNSKTKLGVTPLHLGSMMGHKNIVQLLVETHKAAIDALSLDNRTPLHLAAKFGQLGVASLLLSLGANPNARDSKGQSPLHLAAESDHPDVVKLFLTKTDVNTLIATDENGYTTAHIAAMKGSVAVVRELMGLDRESVLNAATKVSESTALHLAAGGGHEIVVRILIEAGADASLENSDGMTPLHLAAKFGHVNILQVIEKNLWVYCSVKMGLTPIHVAAHFGQIEFVRSMLTQVPATIRSESPSVGNPLMVKELQNESGLCPLHLAAQSGHEGLVRLLLNFQGVVVDSASDILRTIPLHLAAQCGHIPVVGLLLSRSTHQLHIKDNMGRTSLHLASMNGHHDMCALLLGQGSNINATDENGWTALHFATKAGNMPVIKLLLESGADPLAETKEGKVALCFAAAANHYPALSFLMNNEHDTYQLMEDKKFIYDLMISSKTHNFKPIEEFILLSPAPIDVAVKLATLYRVISTKEKERAKDLITMMEFCESTAADLMSIVASDYSASVLLKSQDNKNQPFLDVLIENEQKKVVSHVSVQQYLTEVWNGGVTWGFWRFSAFFIGLLVCFPAWVFFSTPFPNRICRSPAVRFICHLISHIYLTGLLVAEVMSVVERNYSKDSVIPNPLEWILLLWLSGILVCELGGQRSMTRIAILFLSSLAIFLHILAFTLPIILHIKDETNELRLILLYIRNQLFAMASLLCCVGFLEYLTVHHLFGPWAIIINNLMYDLMRFVVVLMLFIVGFTVLITSIYKPAYSGVDAAQVAMEDPIMVLDLLFFALFGLVAPDQMPPLVRTPSFAFTFLKVAFGVYLIVANIVLINLLIAMMSATYERIQAQSDIEWKFGRAKLIRQMNKISAIPAPVIMLSQLVTLIKVAIKHRCRLCSMEAQSSMRYEDNLDSFAMTDGRGPSGENTGKMAETGVTESIRIETAIDWKKVVATFKVFQRNPSTKDQSASNAAAAEIANVNY